METKKCSICGEEVKNLKLHMKKHKEEAPTPETPPEAPMPSIPEQLNPIPDPRYATKEDVQKITGALVEITKSLNELKNPYGNKPEPIQPTKPKEEVNVPKEEIPDPDKMPIPPAWRKMVDETLGLDFGIDVVYPQSGSGFLFKIIVPPEKSNASQAHKEFYKVDIRTKAINYAEGIEGVKKFCELVASNLKTFKGQ